MTARTSSADFSSAFSSAFSSGGRSNLTISGTDPISAGVVGKPGAYWIDNTKIPYVLYEWIDADHRWLELGVFRASSLSGPSIRLQQAALLLAVRWYKLPDAALGLVGGQDIGASYVGRIGKDLEEMLIGFRGLGVPIGQDWPTLALLKIRVQVTTVREDPALQMALDAAIEAIVEFVDGPPAVG